jgi:hypothetical protein
MQALSSFSYLLGHTFNIDTTQYPDWSETVATTGGVIKNYIKLPGVMREYLKKMVPASEFVSSSANKADFNVRMIYLLKIQQLIFYIMISYYFKQMGLL